MIYWLHLLGRYLARLIPLPISYGLAAHGAPLVFFAWRSRRHNAVANVVQMLGPGQPRAAAERLALAAFRNYGRYLIDMLRLGRAEIARVERHLTVRGVEHLDAALARGKGLIFVGGHLGNSDLAVAVLAGRGYPITIIAETLQPPRWNALVQPPLLAERSARLQADVQRLTQQTMDAMETFVREYPDQWFMFRPMWPAAPAERTAQPALGYD